MRAAVYARKSTVDAKRPGKSVSDQVREARAEIEARGWTLVAEHVDDGISASRHARSTARPGFEALLAAIEAREIDVVVMAEQSRITRSLAVLGTLLELCATTGTRLLVGGTELDPGKPEGFLLAGITGTVDASEVERIRQRVLRGARGAALAGRPPGKNVYGYRRLYDAASGALQAVEPDPVAAAVVVEIIDRLLAGESVRSVTLDLNRRGITTATGRPWHPVTLRRTALNPAYAGLRVHQGQVVGQGMWPPLVPLERHQAVVALLTDPARGKFRPGATKHLLSGTARCGVCDGPLRVINDRRRKVYACFSADCMAVTIGYDDLNEYVTAAVVERLSRPDVLATLSHGDAADHGSALDLVRSLETRKRAIGDALGAGTLDLVAAQAALARVAVDLDAAMERLKASVPNPVLLEVVGDDAEARWLALGPEQRAAVVRALVRPVVGRSTRPRGTRGFDPDRVVLHWLG